ASMFHSCWKILRQESGYAVLSFDLDWIDSIYEEEICKIVDMWINSKETFTNEYRGLLDEARRQEESYKILRDELIKKYGNSYNIPRDEFENLQNIYRDANKARAISQESYHEIFKRAESERSEKDVLEDLGFKLTVNVLDEQDEIAEVRM